MKIYVVTFQMNKDKDELAFSSQEYLIYGLIEYIKKAHTKISYQMLKYFEEYQRKELKPWEWLFTDLHGYNSTEFERLLKPFNCTITWLIVDAGLD